MSVRDRLEKIDERIAGVESGDPMAAMQWLIHAKGDLKFLRNLVQAGLDAAKPDLTATAEVQVRETGDLPQGYSRVNYPPDPSETQTVFIADEDLKKAIREISSVVRRAHEV